MDIVKELQDIQTRLTTLEVIIDRMIRVVKDVSSDEDKDGNIKC